MVGVFAYKSRDDGAVRALIREGRKFQLRRGQQRDAGGVCASSSAGRIGKRGNVALVCAVWRAVAVVLSQDAAFAKSVRDELPYCYNKWRMCYANKIKPSRCIFCHTWLLCGTKGDS